MPLRFNSIVALGCFYALLGCSPNEKVWIVIDLVTADGKKAQMSFDNPAVPDMTLQDCESSLKQAVPVLLSAIQSRPEAAGSRFIAAKCVAAAGDPIKPKA